MGCFSLPHSKKHAFTPVLFGAGLAQMTGNKLQCVGFLRSETELPSTIQTIHLMNGWWTRPLPLPGVHRCKNVNSFKLTANDFPHIPRIPPPSTFTSVRSTVPASCVGSNRGDEPSEMNAFQLLLRLLFLGFVLLVYEGHFVHSWRAPEYLYHSVSELFHRQETAVGSDGRLQPAQHAFASVETASLALSKGNNIRLPAPLLYFI